MVFRTESAGTVLGEVSQRLTQDSRSFVRSVEQGDSAGAAEAATKIKNGEAEFKANAKAIKVQNELFDSILDIVA